MPMLLRVVFGILAVVITAMILAATISFYVTFATDDTQQKIYVTLAIVSASLKLLMPVATKYLRGQGGVIFMCWTLFLTSVCFDSFGVAGFFEMTRGGKATAAENASTEAAKLSAEVARLRGRADEYAGGRTVAELEPELERLTLRAGNCGPNGDPRGKLCQQLAALQTDKARAEERDKRESEWREARDKLEAIPPNTGPPDAQADMFEKIGKRLGVDNAGPLARYAFIGLSLIISEVGAPVCAFLALTGGTKPVELPGRHIPTPPHNAATAPAQRRRRAVRPAGAATLRAMLEAVARGERSAPGVVGERGKRISGPLRALGDAFGMSASTMHRQLKSLEAAGSIRIATGASGTVIDLN